MCNCNHFTISSCRESSPTNDHDLMERERGEEGQGGEGKREGRRGEGEKQEEIERRGRRRKGERQERSIMKRSSTLLMSKFAIIMVRV